METTQDIIKQVVFYLRSIWKAKWIVLSAGVLCAVLYTFNVKQQAPQYVAEHTFMVNEDDGGGSGIGSILGNFGLPGGGGNQNYNKIIEIGVSNMMLDNVLLHKVELKGNLDFIGNHIIRLYNMQNDWKKNAMLDSFWFTSSTISSAAERTAIKVLENKLRGNRLKPNGDRLIDILVDQESSILSLYAYTIDPHLSIAITTIWYQHLSDFYVTQTVESQQKTFDMLTAKADSIYNLLTQSERELAKSTDLSLGLIKQEDRLANARALRNVQMYSVMYGEVLKNKETAEYLLSSQTPYFQTIDQPVLPIYNSTHLSYINVVIYCVVGLLLGAVFVTLWTYYQVEIAPMLANAQ